MRNFEINEVGVYNVASKPLPFKKQLIKVDKATYNKINESIVQAKAKAIVIDDSQYLMAFEAFDRAKEVGYGKFTDLAVNFRNLIKLVVEKLPKDVIVYFLHHIEQTEFGKIKAKTIGKMLDSQLTIEGLFSVVLLCRTDGDRHWFETQSDGYTPCKSPMEMFEKEIDNDLRVVDKTIREYYNL